MKSNNICSEKLNKVLKTKTDSGDGSYGTYYKYSQYRGIKILHGRYNTLETAMNSDAYNEALQEVEYLNFARKHELPVPKCYGVKVVLIKGIYHIGIIMQHLGDVTLAKFNTNDQIKGHELMRGFEDLFKSKGIRHLDIHSSNVMRFKKKWWVIDFSPFYISILA